LLALTCRAEWIDVPFVAQRQNGCEAAVTAMVMQYWGAKGFGAAGKASDAATISNSIHSGETNGMAGARIGEYFRRQRFDAYVFAGSWEDLAWHVARGRPLIVSVRNGGSQAPLRYVVVAGLDEKQGVVFVNDAARRKLDRIDRQSFESDWKAGGNWTLLALPQRPR
jgi:uncharacterized protein YvpB